MAEVKEIKSVQKHQKSPMSIKIKTNNEQSEINERKTIKSNAESKDIKPGSLTKNNGDKLKTCKKPWIPQFSYAQKTAGSNKLEIQGIETKVEKLTKSITPIKIKTGNKQIGDELKTCKNPWIPQISYAQKTAGRNKLEIQETETKVQKLTKPKTHKKIKTDNKQNKTSEETAIKSNHEMKNIKPGSLTKNNGDELKTCKNPWTPQISYAQKTAGSNKLEIQGIETKVEKLTKSKTPIKIKTGNKQNKTSEETTIKSNHEMKNIKPGSLTKNNGDELKTCKNPWIPQISYAQKTAGSNKLEIQETETKVQKLTKPKTHKKIKTDNKQNKSSEETAIKSNPKIMNIKPGSLTKNNGDELKTCKNPWVPQFSNAQKTTENKKLEIQGIETKVEKLTKSKTPINIKTGNKQDSSESFYSAVFSMTQVNLVSSTNKLIPRLLSIDLIEQTIDVIFKRAITDPSSISLLVEVCSLLKGIVLSTNKGSLHVSFKKRLAARCQKLLKMGISTISKETYIMIGELFIKKLLPINIMVEFIKDIPNQLTSASIENICYLLKTIGAEIERPYTLKPTMKILETFIDINAKGLKPKYKNQVMDLLELRNNEWIPVKSIDTPPPTAKKDQNVNRSSFEKSSSVPEGRKRGKNRRTKNAQK